MTAPEPRLNRFERLLFKVALALAATLVIVRLGFIAILGFWHHIR